MNEFCQQHFLISFFLFFLLDSRTNKQAVLELPWPLKTSTPLSK